MKLKLPERRRFIRVETPLRVTVISGGEVNEVVTKNVSPVGLRFEIGRELKETENIKMDLYLPIHHDPIHLEAKIIWQNKVSLEDNAPYDIGAEIVEIDDETKNIFLKYLCDLLYSVTYTART